MMTNITALIVEISPLSIVRPIKPIDFFYVIDYCIKTMSRHWLLALMLFVIVIVFAYGVKYAKSKHEIKKTERIYQHAYTKTAKKQARKQQKDLSALAYTCNQIVQMLNQRISIEKSPENLIEIRNLYYRLCLELERNEPIMYTPQALMLRYLESYNDTQSMLYGKMETLVEQYDQIFGPSY